MAHRRDSTDAQWREVKLRINERDRGCRLFKILTFRENLIFNKIHKNQQSTLHPAHILEVSLYPQLTYCDDNIVLLNSISHAYMDRCKHPVTGESISREERNRWWLRILGETQKKALLTHPEARSYFNEVL